MASQHCLQLPLDVLLHIASLLGDSSWDLLQFSVSCYELRSELAPKLFKNISFRNGRSASSAAAAARRYGSFTTQITFEALVPLTDEGVHDDADDAWDAYGETLSREAIDLLSGALTPHLQHISFSFNVRCMSRDDRAFQYLARNKSILSPRWTGEGPQDPRDQWWLNCLNEAWTAILASKVVSLDLFNVYPVELPIYHTSTFAAFMSTIQYFKISVWGFVIDTVGSPNDYRVQPSMEDLTFYSNVKYMHEALLAHLTSVKDVRWELAFGNCYIAYSFTVDFIPTQLGTRASLETLQLTHHLLDFRLFGLIERLGPSLQTLILKDCWSGGTIDDGTHSEYPWYEFLDHVAVHAPNLTRIEIDCVNSAPLNHAELELLWQQTCCGSSGWPAALGPAPKYTLVTLPASDVRQEEHDVRGLLLPDRGLERKIFGHALCTYSFQIDYELNVNHIRDGDNQAAWERLQAMVEANVQRERLLDHGSNHDLEQFQHRSLMRTDVV